MAIHYHLNSKYLLDDLEYDYSGLYKCNCESCEYWKPLSVYQTKYLFLGIIFPPIWFYNLTKIIKALFFLENQPLGTTEYLRVRNEKIKMKSNITSPKYSCLEDHNLARNDMWDQLGHILLAIVIYGFFLCGFIMAFNKSSVTIIQSSEGILL